MHNNLIGDLPWYGMVLFHKNRIANILSLESVINNRKVTYHSQNGNQVMVHKPDGSICILKKSSCGLYYFEIWKEYVKKYRESVFYYDWQYYDWQYYDQQYYDWPYYDQQYYDWQYYDQQYNKRDA